MIAKLFSLCRDIFGFCSYICYSNLPFYVIVFNLFCYIFPWEKVVSYLLETLVILFCYCCLLVLSILRGFFITWSNCWSFGFVLAVFTCPWCSVISITCSSPFLDSVLVPCNIRCLLALQLLTSSFCNTTVVLVFSFPTSSWFTLPFSFWFMIGRVKLRRRNLGLW